MFLTQQNCTSLVDLGITLEGVTYIFPGGLQLDTLVANHSVCFACARLAVGKHGTIVAAEHLLDKWCHNGAVDITLA